VSTMALQATVSKASVSKLNDDDYQVTINVLIVNELEEIILEKDYHERYYSAISVDSVKLKLQDQKFLMLLLLTLWCQRFKMLRTLT